MFCCEKLFPGRLPGGTLGGKSVARGPIDEVVQPSKKRPWSREEDELLMMHVATEGQGMWNKVKVGCKFSLGAAISLPCVL
jgi:hypothetical protein